MEEEIIFYIISSENDIVYASYNEDDVSEQLNRLRQNERNRVTDDYSIDDEDLPNADTIIFQEEDLKFEDFLDENGKLDKNATVLKFGDECEITVSDIMEKLSQSNNDDEEYEEYDEY